ncbi:peptidyl-prolyl cis-trans isomerase [bacterium]|nr:peptidyl-prolyl cis-trans isomerase [bacterium]
MLQMRKQGFVKATIYLVIFFFAASIFFIGAASWFGNSQEEERRKKADAALEDANINPYQYEFDKLKKSVSDEEFSSALATIMVEAQDGVKKGEFIKKTLLTLKDLSEYYIYLPTSMKMNYAKEEGKENLLEKLILEKLIIFDLKQKGIDVKAAIEHQLSKQEKVFKEKNGFSLREGMRREGKSYELAKSEMVMQMAAFKFTDVIINKRQISEEQITQYFEKHKADKYKGQELKKIYFKVKYDAASEISETDIKDYYSKHIVRFKKKDTVSLYHIFLNPDEYLNSVEADDKEIEEYYNRSKENFKTPKLADIQNILIKTDSEKVNKKIVNTPEKIKEYYNSNLKKYMSSKGVKIQYVYFKTKPEKLDISRITDEEAQTYYLEHKKDYEVEGKVRASHILFPTTGMNDLEAGTAKKKAEKILKEIKSGGDFAELAKTHSSCPSKSKGGDLDWFISGAMVKPFEEAAFNSEIGEVVGPVKTRFGYHIIKVTDKVAAENKTFDSVKAGIKEKLYKDNFKSEQRAVARKLKEKISTKDDFTEYVRKHSEGKSKEFNGIAGYFYSGKSPELGDSSFKNVIKDELFSGDDLDNILQKRLFKMETGEITEVLETSKGLFIVKMIEAKDPAPISFEKVKSDVKEDFLKSERSKIAEKIAVDIIGKLNDGVGFDQLAKIWSDGKKAKMGGFVKKVPQGKLEEGNDKTNFEGEILEDGQIPYAVDKAIFSLKENEVTKTPVKSGLGYHVIRVDELRDPSIKPFVEVKAEIKKIIMSDKCKANALADAEKIVKELGETTTKDKFKTLVKKYSTAPSEARDGYVGQVSAGQVQDKDLIDLLKNDKIAEMTLRNINGQYQFGYFIDPQIEKTVLSSPVDKQVAGPVTTKAGTHVFYVDSIKSGEETPLKDVREEIKQDLTMAVSEKELMEVYEKSKDRFKQSGTIKCVHVMFKNESEAKEALAKITSKSTTIEEVMNKLKTGPIGDYQLVLGPDAPSNIPKYIVNAVKEMKVGDISGIIKSKNDFHIIKLLEKKEPSMPAFNQVAPELEKNILNRKAQGLMMKGIEELRKKYGLRKSEKNAKLFTKLSIID